MGSFNKIGVFGHYGNKNLGDEAIILAAIQNITSRLISHGFPFFLFATQEKDNNVIDDILDALNSRRALDSPS